MIGQLLCLVCLYIEQEFCSFYLDSVTLTSETDCRLMARILSLVEWAFRAYFRPIQCEKCGRFIQVDSDGVSLGESLVLTVVNLAALGVAECVRQRLL